MKLARALLRLYPRAFRERHGDAMMATLREARDAARGPGARAVFWARTAWSLTSQGLAERFGRSPEAPGGRPSSGPLGGLATDARQAARSLARSPGFALLVTVTLALGIGANVAIATLVDAVVLRPLPVAEPERLVEIFEALKPDVPRGGLSYVTYRSLAESPAVEGMAAFALAESEMKLGDRATTVVAGLVSGGFFDVLGVEAARGRALTAADETGWGASPVAVLSWELWTRELGADEGIVGRTVELGSQAFTVAGVAPRGFRGVHLTGSTDVWVPVTMGGAVAGEAGLFGVEQILTEPLARVFDVVARLPRGLPPERASEGLNSARLALAHAVADGITEPISLVPLREAAAASDRDELVRFLGLLGAVAGLTLLVACVNVANLLLVRGRRRAHAVAIRSALGAGRWRLFRGLALEALLLGLLSGLAAVLAGRATLALLGGFTLPGGVAVADAGLHLGTGAWLFAGALGLGTALLFGTLPAWRTSGTDALGSLRGSRAASPGHGGWGPLLALQTGLSVLLLVGAALFARTLQEALRTDLGIDAHGVGSVSVRLRPHGVELDEGPARIDAMLAGALRRPHVTGAAYALHVPVSDRSIALPFAVEGREPVPGGLNVNVVSPGYFELLGIPVTEGRAFDAGDTRDGARVIVVNEAAARLLWPDGPALGGQARITFNRQPSTVVGVVGQTLYHDLLDRDTPYVFYPLSQLPGPAMSYGQLIARSTGGSGAALEALRAAVREVDPLLPVLEPHAVADQLDAVMATQRFGATLLGIFGGLALLIAAIGVYGVAAWTVATQRREIGIRLALGARAARVVGVVLRRTGLAVGLGAVAGLLGAATLSGLLEAFLYGVEPLDRVAFGAAAAVLVAVAAVATVLPATRAVRIDPAETMRTE